MSDICSFQAAGHSRFERRSVLYRARPGRRLWRGLRAGFAIVSVAGTCAGCSTSYQLGALFGKTNDRPDTTASVSAKPIAASAAVPDISDADLAIASAAAVGVLAKGGDDESAPWENPRTGARGTVTPLASSYSQDGFTCRDFLASYVRDTSEAWLQGEACRARQGQWIVRSLKPRNPV